MQNILWFKNPKKLSKIATVVAFLTLIRCIYEPFRLYHISGEALPFQQILPFLIGSLVAVFGLFAMVILSYFEKYKIVVATCVAIIIGLLIIKEVYIGF